MPLPGPPIQTSNERPSARGTSIFSMPTDESISPADYASVMLASLSDTILHLHGSVALAIVFLVPALEASAFLGFVFPGEIAVLLGGVLAYQGRVSLLSVIVAAVLGAVIGDSIGYLVGRRWGRTLLHGTVGRFPPIKRLLEKHLDAAQAYVRRRKGRAVFFGR